MSLPDGTAAYIRRGVTHLARRLRVERSDDSVSSGKISILNHLVRWGAMTPGQLAAAEFLQPQSLTRMLAELERAGLVDRWADERDRRQYLVAITAEGRDALHGDMASRDAWLARALVRLTPAERDLLRIAATLMERIADGDDPHAGRVGSAKPGGTRHRGK